MIVRKQIEYNKLVSSLFNQLSLSLSFSQKIRRILLLEPSSQIRKRTNFIPNFVLYVQFQFSNFSLIFQHYY